MDGLHATDAEDASGSTEAAKASFCLSSLPTGMRSCRIMNENITKRNCWQSFRMQKVHSLTETLTNGITSNQSEMPPRDPVFILVLLCKGKASRKHNFVLPHLLNRD